MITTVGLDADDTLWHNENVFAVEVLREDELIDMLEAPHA
jgi:hypothetical protein